MARKKEIFERETTFKSLFSLILDVIHDQEIVSRGLSCVFSFDYKHFLLISFIFFLMKTCFEETY